MPYGEIFSHTLRLIWKEKKLWLLGIIGLSLSALGTFIYLTSLTNWQSTLLSIIGDPAALADQDPEAIFAELMGGFRSLVNGLSIFGFTGLLAYILNLIMRGGTINEASRALNGEGVQIGRGSAIGARKILRMFVIDLIWFIPLLILAIIGIAVSVSTVQGLVGKVIAAHGDADVILAAGMGTINSLTSMAAILAIIALIILILRGIFAPLMYQSAVQKRHSLGASIGEGFRLALSRLGSMLWILIVIAIIEFIIYLVLQLISIPILSGWANSWMAVVQGFMSNSEGAAPTFNSTLYIVLGLIVVVIGLLLAALFQTYVLSVYANVYGRIASKEEEEAAVEDISVYAGTAAAPEVAQIEEPEPEPEPVVAEEEPPAAETPPVAEAEAAPEPEEEPAEAPAPEVESSDEAEGEETPAEPEAAPEAVSGPSDDFTVIHGIGPTYAQKLAAAGIMTYGDLAASNVEALKDIIEAPDWRAVDYAAWIEQAGALAQSGDGD